MMHKVTDRGESLLARISRLPRPIVFTNGVFDVLHRGHVSYLHEARALGASLVVALNSDASARGLGKGPDRPLNTAADRATVIAALESVSLVTFFDEPTPVELIEQIKPDIYVKGGDYDMAELDETRVMAGWGGTSMAIPFLSGYSTTALVKRIRSPSSQKAAFIDRDGVINVDHGYVHEWSRFEFIPGAKDGLRRLADDGFTLVVVTNQSGIARGLYTEAQFQELSNQMLLALKADGINIAKVYHCPHHPDGTVAAFALNCDCRKPKPGMIFRAAAELALDLPASILVGDKASDIAAARAAGLGNAYLVGPDKPCSSGVMIADGVYADLKHCVDAILAFNPPLLQRPDGVKPRVEY